MSVSVETVAAVVSARHSTPRPGGHAGVAGAPVNGGGGSGGGGGGRHGGGLRDLDASRTWSPSPTSIVSAHRGRGGGGGGKRGGGGGGGGDDAHDDDGAGEGGRGMPPRYHGDDPAPLRAPSERLCGPASGSLPTLPLAPRPIVAAGAAVGKTGPPPLGIVGATGGREAPWRLAAKVSAVIEGAVGTPVAQRPSPTASPGRVEPSPVRLEPHAYVRVPTDGAVWKGGAAELAGRAGATTPAVTPPVVGPLSGGLPAAIIGDPTASHRETVAARGTLAERGPLVVYHSAPEVVAGGGASPVVGNTKASVGTPRFLASLASRVQVMAEHGSAVTAKRARMAGVLRRLLIGVLIVLFLIAFASFVRLHATTIRRTCRRLLLIYIHILHARPLVSRAISAGVIFLSADFLAQRLSSSTTPFDYVRLLRYSSYGLIVMGPFLYLWYSVMHLYGPDDTLIGAAQKALFEQITLEPLCIGGYMVWDGAMRRRPMGEVRARLRAQFWGLLLKNAVFWVPANFSNYAAGTPDLRVLYANLCSLFWNVYFSSFVNSLPDTVAGAGSSTGGLGKGRRPPSPPQDESCGV